MDLSGLMQTGERAAPPNPVFTAQVVRADESGLWVVPLGEDTSTPVGPCKGGWTANGTRVPPGALVALVMTEEGPWAIGVDNPALAIADGTLAPFQNPSFEIPSDASTVKSQGWGSFGLFGYVGSVENIAAGGAAHGTRHIRSTQSIGPLFIQSSSWTVLPGSSLETSYYARRVSGLARVTAYLYSCPPGFGDPGLFNPNAVLTIGGPQILTDDWLRYRDTITPPPTHTRLSLLLRLDSSDGNPSVLEVDNTDADLVEIDPAAAHQEFMRRAALTFTGGGVRQVTAGGNVSWGQPLTISGVGRAADEAVAGRFEISMPANGTVIPVHSSGTRTTHTVAGGVIALDADEALWYELPLGATAASQPARFHILGTTAADGYVVPPHWIAVVRRTAWSATEYAAEYRWGDGRTQDPWRTPTLNAGWIDGTIAGRFTKTGDQRVTMRGRVRNGAGSAFTLPVGYWPSVQHEAYVRDGAGAAALITVTTAGVVTTAGNNTDHSIATTFVADQP